MSLLILIITTPFDYIQTYELYYSIFLLNLKLYIVQELKTR